MNVFHTLTRDDFDLQADAHLLDGVISFSDGPDRAYLLYPYGDRGHEETVAIWITDDALAIATLAAVLGVPEPHSIDVRPWHICWIRGGAVVERRRDIGIDKGAHLLATLSAFDALDRSRHLFGA